MCFVRLLKARPFPRDVSFGSAMNSAVRSGLDPCAWPFEGGSFEKARCFSHVYILKLYPTEAFNAFVFKRGCFGHYRNTAERRFSRHPGAPEATFKYLSPGLVFSRLPSAEQMLPHD